MILHILDRMAEAGVEEVLVVTGYYAEALEETVRGHGIGCTFVRQVEINGTASAALLAREWAGQEPFLLTFGDILAEAGHYRGMFAAWEGTEGVLAARHVDDPWQGAAVYIDGQGLIERIVEKPPKGTSTTPWNSAGIYVFGPSLFGELERVGKSPRGEYELTSAVEQMLARRAPVRMFALDGVWMDVGRPEDVKRAEEVVG